MPAPNTTRWMGVGLLGLPLCGALTFWSTLDSQPDPATRYDAWSRFVTTDHYLYAHLFGSIGGRSWRSWAPSRWGPTWQTAAPAGWGSGPW